MNRHSIHVLLPIMLLVVLAACNLQQVSPTSTPISVTDQQPDIGSTDIPSQPTPLPLLSLTPNAVEQGGLPPTAVPLGSTPGVVGTGVPTLDSAAADDRYELQVRDGRTVGVNYNVTVTQGSVTMTMQGPDGVVWQKTFTTTENSRAEVTIQQGGTYEILVDINNFDGNYSISWD